MSDQVSQWVTLQEKLPEPFTNCWWAHGYGVLLGYAVPETPIKGMLGTDMRPAGVMHGKDILHFDQFTHWMPAEVPVAPNMGAKK